MKISFKNWILIGCFIVVFCTLFVTTAIIQPALKRHMIGQIQSDLFSSLDLMKVIIAERWSGNLSAEELDGLSDLLGGVVGMRVTLISRDGTVMGDSNLDVAELARTENHASRPEVRNALEKDKGVSSRFSSTIEVNFMYTAKLLDAPDLPVLVLRIAKPLAQVEEAIGQTSRVILTTSALGVILSLVIALFVAYFIARPVRRLTQTALEISNGNLDKRLRSYPRNEIGDLGKAFDRMADHLQQEIEAVTRSRDRLEAILRSMIEGVLVTDNQGNITLTNLALQEILGLDINPVGRTPSEIMRNAHLIEAIDRVSTQEQFVSLEIRTLPPTSRVLQVEVVSLPGEKRRAGVVAVFHDITERKRIEEMRRDFTANVSHELRTPLAAIRGSVETLLDGALEKPKHARRFSEMILRHVKRLEALVQDITELARIESGEVPLAQEKITADELSETSINAVSQLAGEKEISLEMEKSPQETPFHGDRRYIERALVNLLENAIKYTEAGGRVTLKSYPTDQMVAFAVSDTGIGIPKEYQGRIFERFYRVDKGRSRAMGGTGLGLAIVKHVAQAHKGYVEVESIPGRGSTFRLVLPLGKESKEINPA